MPAPATVRAVSLGGEDIIALYDRHARELMGFFARRTGDPQVALDLLGETFLAAFAARARCVANSEEQRAAWLYRIAAHKLTDHYRRAASERRTLLRIGEGLRGLTEVEYERIEELAADDGLHDRVSAALMELSEEQGSAVRARVLGERSYVEIAGELGVSEQAARARVSRGLRALRRALASTERSST